MSEKRYVKKWLPYALWDFTGIQNWLNEQAAQGYLLDEWPGMSFIGRATFLHDPQTTGVRFCLDPIGERIESYETDQRTAAYAEAGWQFVGKIGRLYAIYRCDDPAAPELYNDPQSLSYAMKRQVRWTWFDLIFWLLWVAILLRDEWKVLLERPWEAVMNLILRSDVLLPVYASILICVLAVAGTAMGTFCGLRRVRRHLRRDEWPPAGRRSYPEAVHLMFTSLAVLLLLGAVAWSRYSGNGKEQILADDRTFPHVKIEEALTEEATVKEILSHDEMMAWNTSRTSSLAPEQYWTTQGAYTTLNGDTVESRMDLDLYTAASPALAEGVYRGSLVSHVHGSLYHRYRSDMELLLPQYVQEERTHPALDRLSVCYDPSRPDIVYIGRRGDTVFILSCDGHIDGEKALTLLAHRLTA